MNSNVQLTRCASINRLISVCLDRERNAVSQDSGFLYPLEEFIRAKSL